MCLAGLSGVLSLSHIVSGRAGSEPSLPDGVFDSPSSPVFLCPGSPGDRGPGRLSSVLSDPFPLGMVVASLALAYSLLARLFPGV